MAQNKEKTIIDVLVDIIDNFGDMGFALELLTSMEAHQRGKYEFRIFTNNTELLTGFFKKNTHLLGKYEILEDTLFLEKNPSRVIFSLFHREIPKFSDRRKRLVLRFDYLSFDPEWIEMNGVEHIDSTDTTKIFEIIPSPLRKSAGLIQHRLPKEDKKTWLSQNHLPEELIIKKWFVIFAYEPTIQRLDLSGLSDDMIIMIIGTHKRWEELQEKYPEKIIALDILSLDSYLSLLNIADMNIVRGEVSFVQALGIGKPFFWDAYKERGGFFEEMSEQFLRIGDFSDEYKKLHRELNTGEGTISLGDLWSFQSEKLPFMMMGESARKKDIIDTIEKYIDSFDFFL